jgi:pentatricopeptide repeat protein
MTTVHGSSGQWQKALQLFDGMQIQGLKPNTDTYNAVITACGRSGQWQHALRVFNNMKLAGVQRDVISYTAAITACGESGAVRVVNGS